MKILSKLLSSILVLVLSVVTLAYILTFTLFSADYYKAKAANLDLYNKLGTNISQLAGRDDPQAQVIVQSIVTAPYVQQKLNPYLDGLQHYYLDNGPAPVIDFSDLSAEAQRQGLQIPADSNLNKPITFNDPTGMRQYLGQINFLKIWGVVLALLLAAGIFAINKGFHRFTAVGKAFIIAGIWEGVIFVILLAAPGMVEGIIKSNKDIGPLAPMLAEFFKAILTDLGRDYGIAAIALAAIGLLVIVVGLIIRAAGHFGHHDSGSGTKFVRPTNDQRPSIH